MKKLYLSLVLILCLALCVFSFASCKKDNDETTAADTESVTTAAPTEHVHVAEDEYTMLTPPSCTEPGSQAYYCAVCRELIPGTTVDIPATGHVPATEYTVDREETCSAAGSKSYHCTVCQKIVEETVVPIPSDPDKHVVEWTVKEPHLLDKNGHRSGTCSLCNTPLEEDFAWEPTIFNSKTAEKVSNGDPNFGTGSYYLSKREDGIKSAGFGPRGWQRNSELTNSSNPTAYFLGDSYGCYILPFIGANFSKVWTNDGVLWSYGLDKTILEQNKPDYVILLVCQRNVGPNFMGNLITDFSMSVNGF